MANDSRELVFRAQIEALAFAASVAIRTSDADAFASAARQLSALSMDMNVPSALRDIASQLHDQLALDMTDSGLRQMSETVAGLAGAANELRSAIAVAKKGKTNLFFPALADAASRALAKFNDLKKAVDAINVDLKAATSAELGAVPDKLARLLKDLDGLKKTLAG